MTGADKHYRAFISYSQQDKAWGKRLHGWLESYRVPLGGMVDVRLPPRLGRFFRDDEDMAAAANIGEIVQAAIADAESLIVICSPRSARSKWVNAEIHHFRSTGRGRKVFAFIIDGVPNSGDPATECFPPALRAAGDPDNPNALPIEPLGLDVRKDGHARACARLAAGLLEVDFDDLWQRDRRRAEQRSRLLVGGLAVISVAFAALAATAVGFAMQARRHAAILSIEGARAVLQEGDADGALLLLLEASKTFSSKTAPDALLIAFDEALQRSKSETLYPLPQGARLFDAAHGVLIVDPVQNSVSLLDAAGPPRVIAKTGSRVLFAAQDAEGSLVTVNDKLEIERRADGRTELLGAFEQQTLFPDVSFRDYAGVPITDFSLSPDGVLLLQPHDCSIRGERRDCAGVEGEKSHVQVFDLAARKLHEVALAAPVTTYFMTYYARLPDGRRVVFSHEDAVTLEGGRLRPFSFQQLIQHRCNADEVLNLVALKQLNSVTAEFSDDATAMLYCTSDRESVLLSTASGMMLNNREDFLFTPDYGSAAVDVQSRLRDVYLQDETTSYVAGGVRGNYLGQVGAVRYDGPSKTLAVSYGRDVLVGEATLFEWRMPNVVTYLQLLGDRKLAVVDVDARAIRVLDFATAHPYAARRMPVPEVSRYYPTQAAWPQRCPPVKATVNGAVLEIAYEPGAGGSDTAGRAITLRLAGPKGVIARRYEIENACVRISPKGRYAAVIDARRSAHIIDLEVMASGKPDPEIGVLPDALDIVFPGEGPGVILVQQGRQTEVGATLGMTILKVEPGATVAAGWRVIDTLFQGSGNQLEATLDRTGKRAIIFEDLGTLQDRGAVLYSLEAHRVFRRLGADFRWLDAGFIDTGEVFTTSGYEDDGVAIIVAIAPHDFVRARTAARGALSPACAVRGQSYRASKCWPREIAG